VDAHCWHAGRGVLPLGARVHAVSLSRIENGDTNVTVATLVALALAYGVELVELVERE